MPAGGTMTIRYTSLCICASHSSRLGSTYLLIVVGWGKMNSGGKTSLACMKTFILFINSYFCHCVLFDRYW